MAIFKIYNLASVNKGDILYAFYNDEITQIRIEGFNINTFGSDKFRELVMYPIVTFATDGSRKAILPKQKVEHEVYVYDTKIYRSVEDALNGKSVSYEKFGGQYRWGAYPYVLSGELYGKSYFEGGAPSTHMRAYYWQNCKVCTYDNVPMYWEVVGNRIYLSLREDRVNTINHVYQGKTYTLYSSAEECAKANKVVVRCFKDDKTNKQTYEVGDEVVVFGKKGTISEVSLHKVYTITLDNGVSLNNVLEEMIKN